MFEFSPVKKEKTLVEAHNPSRIVCDYYFFFSHYCGNETEKMFYKDLVYICHYSSSEWPLVFLRKQPGIVCRDIHKDPKLDHQLSRGKSPAKEGGNVGEPFSVRLC